MVIATLDSITGGALRGVVGPLARAPFSAPTFIAVGTGSAAALGATQPNNPDGRNQQAVLTAGAGAGCYAGLRDVVYGPVVGIRVTRSGSPGNPPFDVEIDGVTYPMNVTPRYDNIAQGTVQDYDGLYVVATDLVDKPHTVKVHLAADVSASPAARTLTVFGWVVAQSRGYHQPPQVRVGGTSATTPTVITTTPTQIVSAGLSAGLTITNTDSVSHTFTVTGPDGVTPWRKITIAAGDVQPLTAPSPRTFAGYKISVDGSGTAGTTKYWTETQG